MPASPLSVVLLGLLLLGGTGCAPQRQHLLERSASYVAYRLPSEQLMGAAREILKERGYLTNEKTGVQRMVKGDPHSSARPVLVRDLELEWRILSRVSPAVARELESQVDQYLATGSK
jgi:hypothetical protein